MKIKNVVYLATVCLLIVYMIPNYTHAQSCTTQGCLAQGGTGLDTIREIAVEADSWARVSPDFARITIILEESAPKAAEAAAKLESRIDVITKGIKAAGLEASTTIRHRDFDFFPDEAHTKPVAPASALQVRAIIAIETNNPQNAAQLVDIIHSNGKASIQDFTTLVQSGHEQKLIATEEASRLARQKAERLAKSLGASLGELLSASAIEDPSGEMLSARREMGQNEIAYGDRDVHIIVNLRYSVR